MKKRGVRLPNLTQNVLKFPIKWNNLGPEGGSSEPLEPPLNPPLQWSRIPIDREISFVETTHAQEKH